MFNVFLYVLFLEDEDNYFANYVNDTTPYFVGSTTAEFLENVSCLTKIVGNHQMIANDDKFHLILSFPEEDAIFK